MTYLPKPELVSTTDKTYGYLNGKLLAGTNITLTPSGTTNETLTIDAAGGGGAYTQGARVYNNASISINNASLTALTFNTERYDTDSIHSTSVNTGRLTCQTSGKYLIIAQVEFASNATGYRAVYLKLNGATYIAIEGKLSTGAGPSTYCIASTIYALSISDYVEVEVYQTSGGALDAVCTGNISPEFMMQRIG